MSDKKFKKIVDKYKQRFEMKLQGFEIFLRTRVDIQEKDIIYLVKNVQEQLQEENVILFDSSQLQIFLHMVAAVQSGLKLETIPQCQLVTYNRIKFLSKQKKLQKIESEQLDQEKGTSKNKEKKNTEQKQKTISNKKYQQIKDEDDEDQTVVNNKKQNNIKKKQSNIQSSLIDRLNTIEEEKTDEVALYNNETNKFDVGNMDKQKANQNIQKVKHEDKKKQQTSSEQNKRQVSDTKEKKLKAMKKPELTQSINKPEIVEGHLTQIQQVSILIFEKTGQDFLNPIIKYQISYKDSRTWRRYSEFEKLMAYLRRKYQGIVLPEIPPKQGIKGGINYFWGSPVNEVFLTQRKQKLQILLNRLLKCQFVCHDQILKKFIEDDTFELANMDESGSYLKTLAGYTDIVFNYSQLKDYGMAYYKYLSDFKTKTIETPLAYKYTEIQQIMRCILITNRHRKCMNQNFNKRREILYNYIEKINPISKTKLDQILEESEIECQQLDREYKNYVQLKSQEGWLEQLLKQKKVNSGGHSLGTIQEDYDKIQVRIAKIQENLFKSMQQFQQSKNKMLANLGQYLIDWRSQIHP